MGEIVATDLVLGSIIVHRPPVKLYSINLLFQPRVYICPFTIISSFIKYISMF